MVRFEILNQMPGESPLSSGRLHCSQGEQEIRILSKPNAHSFKLVCPCPDSTPARGCQDLGDLGRSGEALCMNQGHFEIDVMIEPQVDSTSTDGERVDEGGKQNTWNLKCRPGSWREGAKVRLQRLTEQAGAAVASPQPIRGRYHKLSQLFTLPASDGIEFITAQSNSSLNLVNFHLAQNTIDDDSRHQQVGYIPLPPPAMTELKHHKANSPLMIDHGRLSIPQALSKMRLMEMGRASSIPAVPLNSGQSRQRDAALDSLLDFYGEQRHVWGARDSAISLGHQNTTHHTAPDTFAVNCKVANNEGQSIRWCCRLDLPRQETIAPLQGPEGNTSWVGSSSPSLTTKHEASMTKASPPPFPTDLKCGGKRDWKSLAGGPFVG
ncbi:hypothetical protein NM208_g14042 [Fusarium decemcellulare]|uniref:Uncharacterized protein n=1 Tax=Fusarium decemcellulare TaxID=57161 RepID=A0ACC1RJ07_9HYPO|nr:hypothetical protein NM208_g14042 [Fusarium decemcellulare]